MSRRLRKLKRKIARGALGNPSRIWLQHALAILTVLGLAVATYFFNGLAIERAKLASDGMNTSNAQLLHAQETIALVENWPAPTDPDARELRQAVQKLLAATEKSRNQLSRVSHEDGDTHEMFDELSERIEAFAALAMAVPGLSVGDAMETQERIQDIYWNGGLRTEMIAASAAFARIVEEEANHLLRLRDALLIASALIILAEAVFVFWPAQYTVKYTIRRLQRQKKVLQASRRRLKLANEQLEHMLTHDQLTGLPNRSALARFIEKATQSDATTELHMFLVGLDGFKDVNDTAGHDIGDRLLVKVAHILQTSVNDEDFVARVGGDEFVLVCYETPDSVLDRIKSVLSRPIVISGRRLKVRASIGFLAVDGSTQKPMDILAEAEVAMLLAKSEGGDCARLHLQSMRHDRSDFQKLQYELRDAIQTGQIEPWFQPQFSLQNGLLHGAEVLARWNHPERGLIMPVMLFKAAENAGLIVELDHAVWRAALQQAKRWQDRHLWTPRISLNAAPETLADPNFIERFLFSLNRSGLAEDQVLIEVLETTLIKSSSDMAAINIDQLAECGIGLELDDFGTGYAALSKVAQLPITGLKLDRSLVAPLPDPTADSVARAVLALAAELGLHVVAEGIEHSTQATHLAARGCQIGQGFGFGKPMAPDAFGKWLEKHANRPSEFAFQKSATSRRA
ncbi:putative bifunctional diguanylate cyclase/phosphodiesterase [Yoonia litorea]|uniref:Diguanylate cyclase (GGDEF) domain-containing protein n=1 Tax=Yoonia litorea TaxID=1123755 RepID=A0A1I6MV52_9RHOB|nr:EAL domain-containing protein [Yoonia litorea]SFS19590.1 diguanylate cyclase (GGDEF) domain-containing protein [Yoonia litorea]